ncbi:type II CRISPR RNA-guided endonuclease Cas9 [Verrucomicrobiota bacterium]
MAKRILGLDLGTNSIGWGVVDDLGNGQFELLKRGVHIFQEGVKIEKGNESSRAAERTGYRSARRLKFRRKLRKVRTLKVLSEAGYCPLLSAEELKAWQSKKVYPSNQAFRDWCKTSDPKEGTGGMYDNPYYYRWLAATEKLDLENEADRFKLGRAFYHMAQRRGFKSNRLDTTQESDGVVSQKISTLSEKMNGRKLGQYFWEDCYKIGRKIREVHTSRDDHYLAEFNFICDKQGLSNILKEELWKAIFYQRPLKSQKGLVASCPFEPKKKRVPISHPLFEEFRMWQTLNNIKIKTLDDERLRSLSIEERDLIIPLFFRVSKAQFDFKDIARKLTPRGQKFGYVRGRDSDAHVLFNYKGNQSLSACPFSAKLKNSFGEEYKHVIFDSYCGNKQEKTGRVRTADDILHEVWHVLFSFDDAERVRDYARCKLGLDAEAAEKFSKIIPKQGYGALSLKAIRKILPFLEKGLIYSHAVFFANLDEVIGAAAMKAENLHSDIARLVNEHNHYCEEVRCVNGFVREYKASPHAFEQQYDLRDVRGFEACLSLGLRGSASSICEKVRFQTLANNGNGEYLAVKRLDERVGDYLIERFGVSSGAVKKLYHPSAIETYKPAHKHSDGKYYLGDPRISSIKNPVFMRAMHRVKAVVNELLKQGIITEQTHIHIEMARELNDANRRMAIKTWQRKKETERKKYKAAIEEDLKGQGIEREASDAEILKYQLWEEQRHICPYTGSIIKPSDFIGEDPKFDIEHTIPRSLSCDNSQENKTLCDRGYNRNEKKNRIPCDCPNHAEFLQRIEHWQEEVDRLNALIEKKRSASKGASTKEAKDRIIQQRLVLEMDRNYLRGKYRRFTMTEVTAGFKNSQLVDTRIITKYARLYLKTVFSTVYTVNGKTTDDFRRCWGIEKTRDNHAHHAVDAIVAACVTRRKYDELAEYYHKYESYERNDPLIPRKPHFPKPWEAFTEDMKSLKNEILVSHYAPNHLLKQTKKHAKVRGKGVVQQGKTARGSLHKDTFYGRIKSDGEEKTVVRVPLAYSSSGGLFGFKNIEDFDRIVDPAVRGKVEDAFSQRSQQGIKFIDAFKEPVWMNEEKGISIKKIRCLVGGVKNPIKLKSHEMRSPYDHKQHYYVQNDSVHLVAIYADEADVRHVGFRAWDVAKYGLDISESILHKGRALSLKYTLCSDQLVLFCEQSPAELLALCGTDMCKRLYKVNDLSMAASRMVFRHHMEAREKGKALEENKIQRGTKFPSRVDFECPNPLQRISYKNMNVAVEGVDFRLNVLGEIEFVEDSLC